ncbi:hypothetical protein D1505_26080 [Escherichia coli]|uniref:hypothetical protein n=1 Tax=Escherichia coli TaxID=562 RepID=UPI000BC7CB12|nr:hypothetical protein [Escherichia coli]RIJ69946.1 hypothetical protein D1505_26080 [Escherichia coli]RIX50371.1 hypothetical protein D3I61_27135 [Escherichia coli]
MFSRIITKQVVFMLLLSVFMGWVGHAPALFTADDQRVAVKLGSPHSHTTLENESVTNPVVAEHSHMPFTADHVHEPFHLYALITPVILLVRNMPNSFLNLFMPNGPVFAFERPPRS